MATIKEKIAAGAKIVDVRSPAEFADGAYPGAVNIPVDDIDAFTGVQRPGAPIRQEDVVRLRKANPDSSLESIAMQLGCSLSTVKRHLRRARAGVTPGAVAPRPQPPMSEVLAAFRKLQRRAVVAA